MATGTARPAMTSDKFRELLNNIESEYCRLEAENLGLQRFLVSGIPTNGLGKPRDDEAALPAPVFLHECQHHMAPPTTIGCDQVIRTTSSTSCGCMRNQQDCDQVIRSTSANSCDSMRNHQGCDQVVPTTSASIAGETSGPRSSRASVWTSPMTDASFFSVHTAESAATGRGSVNSAKRPSRKRKQPKQTLAEDIEAIKERVRKQVMNHYDVFDLYHRSGYVQAIAKHPAFENITLFVIGMNSIWLAVDTDYNDAELIIDADPGFQVGENLFCLFFCIEILTRFAAFSAKRDCLRDPWFVFDAGIAFITVLDTWVFAFITHFLLVSTSIGNPAVLRVLRLMRLVRMGRLARLLNTVPELMVLIKGIVAATRSVCFTLLVLVTLLYVFAIAFTQLTKATAVGDRFFPDVLHSMHTLWFQGTLLNDAVVVADELKKGEFWSMLLLFDFFILAAHLTVLNMLIGVLVGVVNTITVEEKETSALTFLKQRVEEIFRSLGIEPTTQCITKRDVADLIHHQAAVQAIVELGVNVPQLIDMVDFIFQSDEPDENFEYTEKDLSFEEFMDRLAEFRGHNFATVKDIMQLHKSMRTDNAKAMRKQGTFRQQVTQSFDRQATQSLDNAMFRQQATFSSRPSQVPTGPPQLPGLTADDSA